MQIYETRQISCVRQNYLNRTIRIVTKIVDRVDFVAARIIIIIIINVTTARIGIGLPYGFGSTYMKTKIKSEEQKARLYAATCPRPIEYKVINHCIQKTDGLYMDRILTVS
jgi:hypothetical protein